MYDTFVRRRRGVATVDWGGLFVQVEPKLKLEEILRRVLSSTPYCEESRDRKCKYKINIDKLLQEGSDLAKNSQSRTTEDHKAHTAGTIDDNLLSRKITENKAKEFIRNSIKLQRSSGTRRACDDDDVAAWRKFMCYFFINKKIFPIHLVILFHFELMRVFSFRALVVKVSLCRRVWMRSIFSPFLSFPFCFSFIKMTIISRLSLSSPTHQQNVIGLMGKYCRILCWEAKWVVNELKKKENFLRKSCWIIYAIARFTSLLPPSCVCSMYVTALGIRSKFQNFIKFCCWTSSRCFSQQRLKRMWKKRRNFVIISKTYCIKAPILSPTSLRYQQALIKRRKFYHFYSFIMQCLSPNTSLSILREGKKEEKIQFSADKIPEYQCVSTSFQSHLHLLECNTNYDDSRAYQKSFPLTQCGGGALV